MVSIPRSVRIGLALLIFGLVCIVVDVVGFFVGWHDTPLWLNLCCLAAPVGLAIAVTAGLRDGRAAGRRALAELGTPDMAADREVAN